MQGAKKRKALKGGKRQRQPNWFGTPGLEKQHRLGILCPHTQKDDPDPVFSDSHPHNRTKPWRIHSPPGSNGSPFDNTIQVRHTDKENWLGALLTLSVWEKHSPSPPCMILLPKQEILRWVASGVGGPAWEASWA